MNKICFTTFVFGNSYDSYIPLFIYSIKKCNPEAGIVIFTHSTIDDEIRNKINLFSKYNDIKIIENHFNEIDILSESDVPYGAALRWLLWDDMFNEYQRLYIADVDIFYCKEEFSVFEQHEKHLNTIKRPFSNIIRKCSENDSVVREFCKDIFKVSFKYAATKLLTNDYKEYRLTGLHYTTVEFHKKILIHSDEYLNQIRSKTKFIHHKRGFSDESFLFDIVNKENEIRNLPVAEKNVDILSENTDSIFFRPHHGLHLGIFRNVNNIKLNEMVIKSPLYRSYYKYFELCSKNDEIFNELEDGFSETLKNEINNMILIYE